jgi:imidazolonepropionase
VYKRLGKISPVRIVSTFLGAHTIPPEFKNDRKGYVKLIINEMIPRIAQENLAQFCDVFVEESAFTIREARDILEAGKKSGLKPKLHADQLTSGGGAELAAEVGAVSADHLEQISETGIQKMSEAGVIGVNLPIASLYTRQPYLNCRKLVNAGVDVAIATDFNPGSAPSYDLELAMMLSCNHGHLTPAEAVKAVTINAARALGVAHETGSLEPGKSADFVILNATDVNFWLYHFKGTTIRSIFMKGKKIHQTDD